MMTCQYLLTGRYSLCTAVRGSMVPSLSEMEAYCAGDPLRCPIHQQHSASQMNVCPEAAMALLGAKDAAEAGVS